MKPQRTIVLFTLTVLLVSFSLPLSGSIQTVELDPDGARADFQNPEGSPPAGWPTDAQSRSGPQPQAGVLQAQLPSPKAQALLLDVPAYLWTHGCGPTAAGMVIGYWDGKGFDQLVPGSAATQTGPVNAMIASAGHYSDYSLPLDSYPTLLPDRSALPAGDEHPDDSVADFMRTSQSYFWNYYGWSWFSDMAVALEGYVEFAAPQYQVMAISQAWGVFTWESFQAEIDAGRPVVLLVDTSSDGLTDHFVTALGYSDADGTNRYAVRDTWDLGIHWFEFAPMAAGRPWGIYGATLFQIEADTPFTPTASPTPTATLTLTGTPTRTKTPTATRTLAAARTPTPTKTATPTPTLVPRPDEENTYLPVLIRWLFEDE